MEVDNVRVMFARFSPRMQTADPQAVLGAPSPGPEPAPAATNEGAAAEDATDAANADSPESALATGSDGAGPLGTACALCGRTLADPRVLPCLHSFCAACLEQLVSLDAHAPRAEGSSPTSEEKSGAHSRSSSGSRQDAAGGGADGRPLLQCPACGHVSRLPPGGVTALPPDYVAQHRVVLASLNRESTRLLCDVCPSDRLAGWRCSECLVNLCGECRAAHGGGEGAGAGAAHEVLALAEARRRGIARVRRQLMCPQHPQRELRLFCGACARLACAECVQAAGGAHRGHGGAQPVARAVGPRARALRDALERARPAAQRGAAALAALQRLSARVQARCSQVLAEVDRFAGAYAAALEQHRRALRRHARDAADAKLAAVRAQARRLERAAGDAAVAVAFCDALLREGSDAEVLSLSAPVLRRLQGLSAAGGDGARLQQLLEAPRVWEELTFLAGESAGLVGGFPLVGVVSTQAACPARCSLGAAALLDCRVNKRAEVVLQMRDSDGEELSHGGEKIGAELRHRDASNRKVPVHVADQRDGTYMLTFIPDTPGRLALSVTVHGTPIQGSPFPVLVRIQKAHQGQYHCCSFCSSGGNKDTTCGCGATMPGGYMGCGHGHPGHPGRRHWSCCGNVLENSECSTRGRSNSAVYQFTL